MFTVAFTSTFPAACAGEATVHSVVEVQLTDVAFVDPNLKIVADVPRANPVPLTVTLVPPALDPVFGLRPVTVGTNLNWSAVEIALVPFGVVTVTCTVPAVSAGEAAVIEPSRLTVNMVALAEPNLTAVASLRLVPVIVTSVPPATGPSLGLTPVTVGGGR